MEWIVEIEYDLILNTKSPVQWSPSNKATSNATTMAGILEGWPLLLKMGNKIEMPYILHATGGPLRGVAFGMWGLIR